MTEFSLWNSTRDNSYTVVFGVGPPAFADMTPQDYENKLVWKKKFADFDAAKLEATRTMEFKELLSHFHAVRHAAECEHTSIILKGFPFDRYCALVNELSDVRDKICKLLEIGPIQTEDKIWDLANFV